MRHDQGICQDQTMTREPLHYFFRLRNGFVKVRRTAVLIATILFCARVPSFAQNTPFPPPGPAKKHASATLRDASFHSASLNREMHYRVLLPPNYNTSAQRYPTLFLLHGLYGDYQNWSKLTSLAKYARNLSLIIAMPDAGNSWYVNSASNPTDKYEDYIVQDFIQEIDAHYRTRPERAARAIAGLSMGGYGAVKFAMKYPSLFAYVGGISAALDASGDLDETHLEFRGGLRKVFGDAGNSVRPQNDVFVLLSHTNFKELPYLYLDCGSDDMFLDVNRKFVGRLQKLSAPYEFHEMPGDHTWNYWDAAIERFLLMLAKRKFARGAMRRGIAQPIERGP
jgi:putative tributyrin esterase